MDDGKASATQTYRCGAIVIDAGLRQVLVDGEPAKLGARAFDVLLALVERRGRVVGKRELLDLVWPKLVVEENNLQVQMVALRKLLGPQAIATIPGRGYRFVAPLEQIAAPVERPNAAQAVLPEQGNLPGPPPMLGRDADLVALAALLGEAAVVTVVGAGGIGKTCLALVAASAVDPRNFPHGRWWIELAAINDGAQLPSAVAGVLGIPLRDGTPALATVTAALASRSLLLVLDNGEHLADALAAFVDAVRAAAPAVRVLATSQELLKCTDEHAYRLGSLAVPDADVAPGVEDALQYGAVALFVERAHAADARFRLGADILPAVVDICRRLDGIALAIELAAARVPLLGVHGLQARLDSMFNVLTGVARMKLRRHQTLRAALDWSVGLLEEAERTVFRRLGVFAGGFSLELAQAVVSDEQLDEWQVLDVLGQLIDKSLIVAGEGAEPRYRLLEPTRAFALEQLAALGESAELLRRHAVAVLALVEADDAQRWTTPLSHRQRLYAELGNLRAAIDWALATSERTLACRLLGRSWSIWHATNNAPEALRRMRALLPLPAGTAPDVEMDFYIAFTRVRSGSGRDEFLDAALRAVRLARAMGEPTRLGDALMFLVSTAATRNENTDIGTALEEAAALVGHDAPPRRRAMLATVEGSWLLRQHDYAGAIAAYERQAGLYQGTEAAHWSLVASINKANVYLDAADFDAAALEARRAFDGMTRLGAPLPRMLAASFLAQALAMRGDDAEVLPLAREGVEKYRGTDAASAEIMAVALRHARRGDFERAGLIAGYARAAVGRSKAYPCPIDLHMRRRLRELVDARIADDVIERWQSAGEHIDEAQMIAIAFDGAPIEAQMIGIAADGAAIEAQAPAAAA